MQQRCGRTHPHDGSRALAGASLCGIVTWRRSGCATTQGFASRQQSMNTGMRGPCYPCCSAGQLPMLWQTRCPICLGARDCRSTSARTTCRSSPPGSRCSDRRSRESKRLATSRAALVKNGFKRISMDVSATNFSREGILRPPGGSGEDGGLLRAPQSRQAVQRAGKRTLAPPAHVRHGNCATPRPSLRMREQHRDTSNCELKRKMGVDQFALRPSTRGSGQSSLCIRNLPLKTNR